MTNKNYVYTVPGGGIFSRFFQCAVVPLADIDFDNVYLKLAPFDTDDKDDILGRVSINHVNENLKRMALYGIHTPYEHVLGYVLEQKKDHTYRDNGFLRIGEIYNKIDRIEDSKRLDDYRAVIKKLPLRSDLMKFIENCCMQAGIGHRTLGVHVRLTTMNYHGGNVYQELTLKDYIPVIERAWCQGHYDKIFIASDNHESIEKLHRHFGNIITSYPNFYRLPHEDIYNEEQWAAEADWFFHEYGWHQAFSECLTLAHCGALVCRESNLANMAVVFSHSLKQFYRVFGAIEARE